jgi:hypothetical protein
VKIEQRKKKRKKKEKKKKDLFLPGPLRLLPPTNTVTHKQRPNCPTPSWFLRTPAVFFFVVDVRVFHALKFIA